MINMRRHAGRYSGKKMIMKPLGYGLEMGILGSSIGITSNAVSGISNKTVSGMAGLVPVGMSAYAIKRSFKAVKK